MEMLGSQTNLYALLGSLTAGTLLAFPFGFGVAALPLLAYGASAAITSLFVPSHPGFQKSVDVRKRRERRERARESLMEELVNRASNDSKRWDSYRRMRDRIESLRKVAKNRKTTINLDNIEQLEDAAVNYLGLWLAKLAIEERERTFDEKRVTAQLKEVENQIASATSGTERRRLEKARDDFSRVLNRRRLLRSKEASVEAAMLALVDTFEEVYQGVMTNPQATDLNLQLQQAVDRINIEEELGSALEEDLAELMPARQKRAAQKAS
jgi:hypothetical protein